MNKIISFIDKHKKYILLTVIVSILITISVLLSSYAYLTWQAKTKPAFSMTIGEIADVTFTTGNNISGILNPVLNYTDGLSTSFSVINKNNKTGNYKIELNINSIAPELASTDVKYVLLKDNVKVIEGNFNGSTSNTSKEIYVTPIKNGTTNYKFYIYIDGNLENNSNMIGKSINANINIELPTAVELINFMYENSPKQEKGPIVENIEYEYAPSVNLMNDRFADSAKAPDSGNIRYYGKIPNNYIKLGPDMYRIIGLFKDMTLSNNRGKQNLVKLVREESIGQYSFDTSSNDINGGKGLNQWGASTYLADNSPYEGADLMRLLNQGFENNQVNNSVWWNSEINDSICYVGINNTTGNCNLHNNIMKSNKLKNIIEEIEWNVGILIDYRKRDNKGIFEQENKYNTFSDDNGIVTYSSKWTGKIGLENVSDYNYAKDFNLCKSSAFNNTKEDCTSCNWIYKNKIHYLMTAIRVVNEDNIIQSDIRINFVRTDGIVTFDETYRPAYTFPVFYLKNNTIIEGGTGTSTDPYIITA